ncbi:MACPF domain-containing protein At1g14780-like [Vicia villosa]|uniref:MACPF domain-containing protein At1g14780-like n=1 Tax=Vicia villosa TaxID=3911 RepID=UPI00273C2BF7|nr:MACPF domain-containing protein At1g14780-like [Vicia villosa]
MATTIMLSTSFSSTHHPPLFRPSSSLPSSKPKLTSHSFPNPPCWNTKPLSLHHTFNFTSLARSLTKDQENSTLVGEDSAVFDLTKQKITSWIYFTAVLGVVLFVLNVAWIDNSTGFSKSFVDAVSRLSDSHEVVMLILFLIFAVFHSGMASLRDAGEKLIGERAFRVIFAGISLPLAVTTVVYFINHRYDGVQLWQLQSIPGIHSFLWLSNFISFFFLYPSTFNLLEVAAVDKPKVHLWETGIIRITRHPQVPEVFNRVMQSSTTQFTSISETSSKDGLTIICSKRGGDVFKHNHSSWLQTMASSPEAIHFKFVPISSLLTGIPGSGYLSHAINLYLRYKPSTEDLQYFLEFQIPREWAPMFSELPLRHQRKKPHSPPLQFSFMSPKLHINSTQVVSEQKPVVGLRLYLEGRKCDKLAIHIHHLSSLPNTMELSSTTTSTPMWRGSDNDESSDQFAEPIRCKRFAHVCTSLVKYDPNWLQESNSTGVYIVTGAQLISKGNWPKNMLHLRLLYTHIPNCSIRKTEWASAPEASRKSSFFTNLSTTFSFTQQSVTATQKQAAPTALNSGVYPDGPPVPVRSAKMLKYVETSEVLRGPHDAPGHWLVIAAKLVTEVGKIGLQVKFALLDY